MGDAHLRYVCVQGGGGKGVAQAVGAHIRWHRSPMALTSVCVAGRGEGKRLPLTSDSLSTSSDRRVSMSAFIASGTGTSATCWGPGHGRIGVRTPRDSGPGHTYLYTGDGKQRFRRQDKEAPDVHSSTR